MRLFSGFCATVLFSGLALGQGPARGYAGNYGHGPYVPLVTTPEISLQTAAPASVGARNATYGLEAGARNSTFETLNNQGSSNYTEPVWYSGGGAPEMSPEVSLEAHTMYAHREMRTMMKDREGERAEAAPQEWTYFGASEMDSPVDTSAGKSARHATRTITNDDIDKANQNTGNVKYDGKTEKIQ
jgi:hypothetical protein